MRRSALTEHARAFILVARTTWLFRVAGASAVARATHEAMTAAPSSSTELEANEVDPWLLQRALARAKRAWPLPVRCLQTALVYRAMLRRHGLDGQVQVGVKTEGRDLEGHAWVVVGDYTIDEDRVAHSFLPMSFDAADAVLDPARTR